MHESVFETLRSGATLLTASHRQARTLQVAYGRRMQQAGRQAWPSPDLLTWNAWLERCWGELSAPLAAEVESVSRALLSPVQETRLWEAIIGDSAIGNGLLQTHTTAHTAEEAWALSWEWGIPLPTADGAPNEDVRAFAIWTREFEKRCRSQGWQDRNRLPDVLGTAFESGRLKAPKQLLLFGFGELTHQHERLIEILRRCGTAVEAIETRPVPKTVVRYELPAPLEEIAAAAQWARERLETGASRIGVIVPDLGAMRPQVVRIFGDTFTPCAVLPGSPNAVRPYNLSLGQALSHYPVIHTAFQILELGRGELSCEEAGSLLRSPFLGGAAEECARRALLDVACRQGEPLVRINGLLRLAQDKNTEGQPRAHAAPLFAARLKDWRTLLDTFRKKQLPSVWTEAFARELRVLGWPGDRTLNSEEYQAVEAWRELLSALSSLDAVTDRVDYAEALLTLRRLASERIFQPQSPELPVQIMGLLEAAGLEFDYLWITGLHDAAWPGSPRPNPFIPIELQRRHNLPHAFAARELEFAHRLTSGLLASAPEVIVSHPRRSGDEDLRPSPLIAPYPASELEAVVVLGAFPRLLYEARLPLEQITDERAPGLTAGTEVRSGTGVFKDQAACPFRAFAHARLGARALDEPEPGLDALGRGILLHGAMERVWRALKSHANLCRLPEGEVNGAVHVAVADAIAKMARAQPQTFTPRFIHIEQARLERLVIEWLELEKLRAPFTVLDPEKGQTASFGGVTVNIKPDRIDAIEDGGRMVIDYKTGKPKIGQWFGDRPDDPQLPLYSLAQKNTTAVAFAQIRKNDTRFLGIAHADGIAPNVKPLTEAREASAFDSWPALLADWRRVLDALGEAFRAGDARVSPKMAVLTCEYCDLGPLCRVQELGDKAVPDGAEEEP